MVELASSRCVRCGFEESPLGQRPMGTTISRRWRAWGSSTTAITFRMASEGEGRERDGQQERGGEREQGADPPPLCLTWHILV